MTYAEKFTNAQRQIAYKQGQKVHGKQVAKQQARARKNRSVEGADNSKGKVHFDGDRAKLNKIQRASLNGLEVLAKTLGVQIYVENFEGTKNANKNGWYDPKDGSIHININAGADGKGTMLVTVAHELAHFIKQWSPSRFERMANFLTKQYTAQGQSISELVEAQRDAGRQEAVTQALEKENAKLREDVAELRELVSLQRQVTNGTKFTKTSVEAAAISLKQSANAKGDTKGFAKLLNGLYEYIASTKELTWEGVKEQAQGAVDWLWEHIDRRGKRSDYAWENNCHGGSLAAYR